MLRPLETVVGGRRDEAAGDVADDTSSTTRRTDTLTFSEADALVVAVAGMLLIRLEASAAIAIAVGELVLEKIDVADVKQALEELEPRGARAPPRARRAPATCTPW